MFFVLISNFTEFGFSVLIHDPLKLTEVKTLTRKSCVNPEFRDEIRRHIIGLFCQKMSNFKGFLLKTCPERSSTVVPVKLNGITVAGILSRLNNSVFLAFSSLSSGVPSPAMCSTCALCFFNIILVKQRFGQ